MNLTSLTKILVLTSVIGLSACVTTSTGPFDGKKDLAKAEATHVQIGYKFFEKEDFQNAKKSLITALDINPRSAGAHLGLARVYERELEFDLAESHFKKAIRYNPESEYHFQYGAYLYNRGEYKDAYKQFKEVLENTVYVRRAQTFELQGFVAQKLEKTDVALNMFHRAIAVNPMMASSYVALTRIYFEQKDYVTAAIQYKGFVDLVRAKVTRQNASTVWLGLQLARETNDEDSFASLELQMKNQFADSPEYQEYIAWK